MDKVTYEPSKDNVQKQVALEQTKQLDYYSIMSSFQHMLIARQMDLQNAVINYIKKRSGTENSFVNLLVILIIMHPMKALNAIKQQLLRIWNTLLYTHRFVKAIKDKKPAPEKIMLEVKQIHENTLNHLYSAFDWYLKSNNNIVSKKNHIIATLKSPIEGSKNDKDFPILKSQPQEQTSEIKFHNCLFYFEKKSKEDKIYSPTGEMKRMNYILYIWSYEASQEVLDKLCTHVANQYAKSKVDAVWSQKMYTNSGTEWKEESLGRNKRKISTVILQNDYNKKLMDSLTHFLQTEEWHLDRGIPWKKSFLFHGPPGTGKTSMIKSISYEVQRHIHYLNLSTVTSDEMLSSLMSKISFNETIIVMEDIDAMSNITHQRKTEQEEKEDRERRRRRRHSKDNHDDDHDEQQKSTLTLSGLLNQIDGIHNNHGMILVMTTNHVDKLDEALIRDGRVDDKVYFGPCDSKQIYMMFKNFYNGSLKLDTRYFEEKFDNFIKTTVLAPCKVENAMRKYYEDPNEAIEYLLNPSDNLTENRVK